MPNWAGSSWYYIAYCISENLKSQATISKQITSSEIQNKFKYWLPVDWYNGGMEHTTLHLLYSRFWNLFLYDIGMVPMAEPYRKRTSHGLILAEGGVKMSKSKENVVNPDDIIERFGADTLRLYELFMGPFDQAIAWSEDSLVGPRRFLEKVWRLSEKVTAGNNIRPLAHKTIKKITEDIESTAFNTAVSALMILVNDFEKTSPTRPEFTVLIQLLAPMAPHISEELWSILGNSGSVHSSGWPVYSQSSLIDEHARITVQINGKARGSITAPWGSGESIVSDLAHKDPEVHKYLENVTVARTILVPDRVINFVTK
jgi:leucyl-tRNA synthetase